MGAMKGYINDLEDLVVEAFMAGETKEEDIAEYCRARLKICKEDDLHEIIRSFMSFVNDVVLGGSSNDRVLH